MFSIFKLFKKILGISKLLLDIHSTGSRYKSPVLQGNFVSINRGDLKYSYFGDYVNVSFSLSFSTIILNKYFRFARRGNFGKKILMK